MQLSAADCGEWLLGRVLGALLLLLADKKNEKNSNDDDDANDDDSGEKKATNEVRGLLLAAGVDEATVEQTVKELNWKVRRQRAVVFVFLCDFVRLQTRAHTTCLYVFDFCLFCAHPHSRPCIDNSFKVVRVTQRQQRRRRRRRRIICVRLGSNQQR